MGLSIPKESDLQTQVLDWLALHGHFAVRVNSAAFSGTHNGKKRFFRANNQPGCSDILACVRGTFVAIECKRTGARTDPMRLAKQQAFLASVSRAGGIGVMVESVKELEEALTTTHTQANI